MAGFRQITSLHNLIAVDKTRFIELLDKAPRYQYLFLRPPGWGKTTFLQTLLEYYDITKKGSFKNIFGDLYIGKHPTRCRNSLLVLRFDFSTISGTNTPEAIQRQFNRTVNSELKRFLRVNQEFLRPVEQNLLQESDALHSLMDVLVSRRMILVTHSLKFL